MNEHHMATEDFSAMTVHCLLVRLKLEVRDSRALKSIQSTFSYQPVKVKLLQPLSTCHLEITMLNMGQLVIIALVYTIVTSLV